MKKVSASIRVAERQHSGSEQLRTDSPYIVRLRVFNRLTCISAWPLLKGSLMALCSVRTKRIIGRVFDTYRCRSIRPAGQTAARSGCP